MFLFQSNHTENHLGLWYTIPAEEFKALFGAVASVPLTYNKLVNTFNESSLLIRRPAVSVISYIKQMKLDAVTPPKFLFCILDAHTCMINNYLQKFK